MDFVYSIHHYIPRNIHFLREIDIQFKVETIKWRTLIFSQNEVEIKKYPVISIIFVGYKASEVNLTNVKILYHTTGMKGYHELQTSSCGRLPINFGQVVY